MAAPRLIDKKLLATSLAEERRQEIIRGVKLAKSIDALRETKAEEEAELERFRTETVRQVYLEIDSLIKERDTLREEVAALQVNITEYGRN